MTADQSRPLALVATNTPTVVTIAPPAVPSRARRGRTRRWLIGAVVVVLAAAALETWRASQASAPMHYVTTRVTRGPVIRAVTASGSVNPETTVQVGTYVSGVIQEVYCDYNTQVHRGQLCAKIDPRPYQTVVDQDRANLSTARAQLAKDETLLTYAAVTLTRTKDLFDQQIASRDNLDAATSAHDQAAAQIDLDRSAIEQHEAALNAAQINLTYTEIVAPVTGTVVARNVTMGQTVAASFQTPTLFLVATDLTRMQVDANVSESDIGAIEEGSAATFTVEAFPHQTFEGRIKQVRQAPQTVQNVVTYDVVISVANPALLLKPGMTATLKIVIDERKDTLRVPDQALRYVPGGVAAASAADVAAGTERGARVWVIRGNRPEAVPVTIGLDDDTYAEILSGDLKPGDEVVISEQPPSTQGAGRTPLFRL